jgi:hypothetical protein
MKDRSKSGEAGFPHPMWRATLDGGSYEPGIESE